MKSLGKHIFILILVALFSSKSADGQVIWSTVTTNKKSAFIGEPIQVSIKVYTTTWFTSGVDPGNIKVDGAYTVFFRNTSISTTRDGKTCPGVDLIINVFPNSQDDIVFPALDLEVESPKEGDYKGVLRKIKTKELKIAVKPIPPSFDQSQWLVTSSLNVNQQWKGNLKNVKVGDVIQRTISREASNTVSQLLPAVFWDSIPGISQYPALSSTNDHRGKTAISASRTETMRYLFEKEGEITLPEMVFTWWNPYHNKLYKHTLKAITVDVQPNPDLGMLATIKDSLAVETAQIEQASGETAPRTILGMSLKKFFTFCAALVLLAIALVLLIRWGIQYRKNYLSRYHNSELFYWRKFKRAVSSGNRAAISESAYRWIDALHLSEPTLSYFAKLSGDETLIHDSSQIEANFGKAESALKIDINKWQIARKRYLHQPSQESKTVWINP